MSDMDLNKIAASVNNYLENYDIKEEHQFTEGTINSIFDNNFEEYNQEDIQDIVDQILNYYQDLGYKIADEDNDNNGFGDMSEIFMNEIGISVESVTIEDAQSYKTTDTEDDGVDTNSNTTLDTSDRPAGLSDDSRIEYDEDSGEYYVEVKKWESGTHDNGCYWDIVNNSYDISALKEEAAAAGYSYSENKIINILIDSLKDSNGREHLHAGNKITLVDGYEALGLSGSDSGTNADGEIAATETQTNDTTTNGTTATRTTNSDGNEVVTRYNENGRTEFTYDENGNQISQTWYDENGNATETTTYGEDGNRTSFTTYEYDENGNLAIETYKDENGDVESITKYCYDENGIATSKTYDADENVISEAWYNENGNITYKRNYDINSHNATSSCTFEYDENENLTTETYKDENGDITNIYKYEYDEDGQLVSTTVLDKDGNVIPSTETTETEETEETTSVESEDEENSEYYKFLENNIGSIADGSFGDITLSDVLYSDNLSFSQKLDLFTKANDANDASIISFFRNVSNENYFDALYINQLDEMANVDDFDTDDVKAIVSMYSKYKKLKGDAGMSTEALEKKNIDTMLSIYEKAANDENSDQLISILNSTDIVGDLTAEIYEKYVNGSAKADELINRLFSASTSIDSNTVLSCDADDYGLMPATANYLEKKYLSGSKKKNIKNILDADISSSEKLYLLAKVAESTTSARSGNISASINDLTDLIGTMNDKNAASYAQLMFKLYYENGLTGQTE